MLKTARGAILLVFAAFGATVGAHLGAIPVIIGHARVSDIFFGQAQSITMLAALAAMLAGGWLGRHFDHRRLILFLLPALAVSLLFALLVVSPVTYLVSIMALASLLSMLDIHMNAEGAIIEEEVRRPIYSMFHAAVSFMMAVCAILSSFLSVEVGPWSAGLLAFFMLGWAAWETARLVTVRPPSHHDGPRNVSALPFGKLALAGSAIGLGGVCELLSVIYAGQFLVALEPALAAYSGLGVAFFGGCMAAIRFFGDRLRASLGEKPCMASSLLLAFGGFAVLSFQPGFLPSVLAFAAVGVGLAFISPILFPLVGRLVPSQRSSAMGIAFAIANVYRFVTPWFVGLLVAKQGLNVVFIVCAAFALASLGCAMWILAIAQNEKGATEAAPNQLNSLEA